MEGRRFGRDRPLRGRHAHPPRGARRRARRRRARSCHRGYRRVPGSAHPLCMGRDLGATGARPADAKRAHADGARRTEPRARACAPHQVGAAKRAHARGDQGSAATERDLLRRSCCQRRLQSVQRGHEGRDMSKRTTPPYRADHVGSLLRPPELLQARGDFARRRISADELRAKEDEAIKDAVRMQEEVGLQSATDGEFRRTSWHMDFIYQLDGIDPADEQIKVKFHNEQGDVEFKTAALTVHDRVGLSKTIFGDAFETLKETTTKTRPKLTIPSPSMVHYRGGQAAIDRDVYPDVEQFWSDLVAAYREEVRRLAELGCTYLQFDDTSLAYLNDPKQREYIASIGGDKEHQHEVYIRHINEALAERPEGMNVTTHMCRGNFRSSWAAEGGYDFVAEALFNELQVDGFFLEYDDERSGTFEPLRFVPKGKQVVLGLVTTKRGELEDKDVLKRRVEGASRYVPLDQLCLSPQCGFSSTVEGNLVTREQQEAKLRLIVETAEEIWG